MTYSPCMLIHNPLAFQLAFQKEKNRKCLLEILNKTLYTTPAQPYPQDFSFSGFHLGFIVWGGKFPQPSGAGDMPPPDLIMC